MRKHTILLAIISTLIILIGVIMKIMHLPGANIIIGIGTVFFVFGFAVSFVVDKLQVQSRRAVKASIIILSMAFGLLMLSALFKFLHLPGPPTLGLGSLALLGVYIIFFSGATEGRKLQLRKDRQLAAILFTDIVGFTAMMGEDEDKALLVLDKNRKIQKKIIRKHRGKWLKEMGDGSLVVFYTATEAVAAAIEIQRQIQKEAEFNVRMGIHISEIFFTDKDVFGDGVNIASRISDKASSNEICISDTVHQNIRNREDLRVESLGEMKFKNVSYPLKIYSIDTSGDQGEVVVRKLAN